MNIASIDIGTNTVLMTIANYDSENRTLNILKDCHNIARLGEGVDKNRSISQKAMERAENILLKYKEIALTNNVIRILACGTSALRDAQNKEEVINRLSEKLESQIEIIDGESEAKFSFIGTVDNSEPSAVIDIGGGSTEIAFGENGKLISRVSLDIGAVRVLERFFGSLPPKERNINLAIDYIQRLLSNISIPFENYKVYGVAGTVTNLASIDLNHDYFIAKFVHDYPISLDKVSLYSSKFLKQSHEELIELPSMHPNRADLMPAGSLILKLIMEKLNKKELITSIKGLRYGILKELAYRVSGYENLTINLHNIF